MVEQSAHNRIVFGSIPNRSTVMNKRIKNKIVSRFQVLDFQLSQFFLRGDYRKYRNEITYLRSCIQYWKRRYPKIYSMTFGLDIQDGLDAGHLNAGRW